MGKQGTIDVFHKEAREADSPGSLTKDTGIFLREVLSWVDSQAMPWAINRSSTIARFWPYRQLCYWTSISKAASHNLAALVTLFYDVCQSLFEMKNEAKGCPRAVLDRPGTLEIGCYLGKVARTD